MRMLWKDGQMKKKLNALQNIIKQKLIFYSTFHIEFNTFWLFVIVCRQSAQIVEAQNALI